MRNVIKPISFFLIALNVILFSCVKKIEPTTATITVRDVNNKTLENVQVIIHGQSTTIKPAELSLIDTAFSDSYGKVTFDYSRLYKLGQAGVGVLDIDVYKIQGSDTLEGHTYIKLEAEKKNESTLMMLKKIN